MLETTQYLFCHALVLTIEPPANAEGQKTSSAQLTERYREDELIGRQVAAVINFPKKQIAKVISEVLVLGFPDAEGRVVLIGPDHPVPNGGRLF